MYFTKDICISSALIGMQINTRSPALLFFLFLGDGLLGGTSEAEPSELSEEAALARFLAFLMEAMCCPSFLRFGICEQKKINLRKQNFMFDFFTANISTNIIEKIELIHANYNIKFTLGTAIN